MNDVTEGKIDCIVVKDLSRFGRNYLETGDYLEKIFPMIGIRFIAINDHYDSEELVKNVQIAVPIKDMINELYSRDLSKKVKETFEVKKLRGERICRIPFGYIKDSDQPQKMCLDQEMVPVILEMVHLLLNGKTPAQIAGHMTSEKRIRPIERSIQLGQTKKKEAKRRNWNSTDVENVLYNPVYTGATVYDRFQYTGDRYRKSGENPMEKWRIIKNTHPAIFSWEEYEKIRSCLEKEKSRREEKRKKRVPISEEEKRNMPDMFQDIFFCGECGKAMRFYRCRNQKGLLGSYHCNCKKSGKKSVSEKSLKEIVLTQIVLQIQLAGEYETLKKKLLKTKKHQGKVNKIKLEKQKLEVKIQKMRRKRIRLYEDYADHLLFPCSRKVRRSREEERVYVDHCFEAIVSDEEYEQAQKIIRKQKRPKPKQERFYRLKGKVFCVNCHRAMAYEEQKKAGKFFQCRHWKERVGEKTCLPDKISEPVLASIVFHGIKNYIFLLDAAAKRLQKVEEKQLEKGRKLVEEIRELEESVKKMQNKKVALYESYSEEQISREEFKEKSAEMTKQIQEYKERITEKKEEKRKNCDTENEEYKLIEKTAKEAAQIVFGDTLTREMVEAFLERIEVEDLKHVRVEWRFMDVIEKVLKESWEKHKFTFNF